MEYERRDGAWSHPTRTAVFVGALIDRGPAQVETVDLVRRMVEAGAALTIIGNHEFNAIAWATPDPRDPGTHLRPHSRKNHGQHDDYLGQVGEGGNLYRDTSHGS